MNGLKLVEQLQAQFADVLRVAAIAVEAARKNASANKEVGRRRGGAMGLLAGERFARNFAKQSFANADARNGKRAQIQIAAERDEDQCSNAHDVGAIAADTECLHARFDVAAKQIRQAFAEKREFKRGEPVFARTRCKIGKRFGVAAECDGKFAAKIWARRKFGFKQGVKIFANLLRLDRRNRAGNSERRHQANGTNRQLRGLNDGVVAQNAEFQTAAAEVDDATKRRFRAKRRKDRFPAEARFFVRADDFEANF